MATYTAIAGNTNYTYTLTLTQSYTPGSSKITYNYTLVCTTKNNYYYQNIGTTRICKIKYNNVEKTIFNNYAQISVNKNGDTILDTDSIELDRYTADEYTPQVYFTVYTTAGYDYLPGTATYQYYNGETVPAQRTACQGPSISSPSASTLVSNTRGFTLTWGTGTAGTQNPITGYKVQCKVGSGSWKDVGTTNASTKTYTITPSSYGGSAGYNFTCRVKCIETYTMADNWGAERTFVINTPPAAPAENSLSPRGQSATIGSSSSGYTVKSSNRVQWYEGSTFIAEKNNANITINPGAGSSKTYTAWGWDGIDWSTTGLDVTVTKLSVPSVSSVTVSTASSGSTSAYTFKINASPTRSDSRTVKAHAWRLSYEKKTVSLGSSSSASLSNINLFDYITSTEQGAISYTIDYRYQDNYDDWSDWKSSSAQTVGANITNIVVYNQHDTSNLSGYDFATGRFYDRGRVNYKIGGYFDTHFKITSLSLTGFTVTLNTEVHTSSYNYGDFTIGTPTSLTLGQTYTVKFTLTSLKNDNTLGGWTKTSSFTFTECESPIGNITLGTGNTLITKLNPNQIASGAKTNIYVDITNGATRLSNTNNLYFYSSSSSTASSNYHTLLSKPTTGTVSGSTYTSPQINQADIYQVGPNGYGWYDESKDGYSLYIVIKYTNTLGRAFSANAKITINFTNKPSVSGLNFSIKDGNTTYTRSNYPNLKLQYNKNLIVTASVTTYNTGDHSIKLYIKPYSGGSWSLLKSQTYNPGVNGQKTATVTIPDSDTISIPLLTSAEYNLMVTIYHNNRTTEIGSDTLVGDSAVENAIVQCKGSVTLVGVTTDSVNQTSTVKYSYSSVGIDLSVNQTDALVAEFQRKGRTTQQGTDTWLTRSTLRDTNFTTENTDRSFTNVTMNAVDPETGGTWRSLQGRIKITLTTTQTLGNNNVTSTYTYYSNEITFYNIIATVSYRENYLGINAASFSETDVLVVQSLTNRSNIRLVKDTTIGTVALTSAGMALTNFIIDCGSW